MLVNARSNPVDRNHVNALRDIQFAFPRNKRYWRRLGQKKYFEVYEEWKQYVAFLNTRKGDAPDDDKWKKEEQLPKLIKLIEKMGKVIDMPVETSTLTEKYSYIPGRHTFEQENEAVLKSLGVRALQQYTGWDSITGKFKSKP
jgi:hypothetical protein